MTRLLWGTITKSPAARLEIEAVVGECEYLEVEPAPRSGWAHRPGAVLGHDETTIDEGASLLDYAISRYARRHPELAAQSRALRRDALLDELSYRLRLRALDRRLRRVDWARGLPQGERWRWGLYE